MVLARFVALLPVRRARSPLALPLVALALVGGACGPAPDLAHDVGVELAFDPAPRVGDTTCTVRLTDPAGAPLRGARIEVEGNMNHAGMVPVFADPAETEPGRYEAPFEFTMGGDWFVIVRAELQDGRSLEQILDLPGVAVTDGGGGAASCCKTEGQ